MSSTRSKIKEKYRRSILKALQGGGEEVWVPYGSGVRIRCSAHFCHLYKLVHETGVSLWCYRFSGPFGPTSCRCRPIGRSIAGSFLSVLRGFVFRCSIEKRAGSLLRGRVLGFVFCDIPATKKVWEVYKGVLKIMVVTRLYMKKTHFREDLKGCLLFGCCDLWFVIRDFLFVFECNTSVCICFVVVLVFTFDLLVKKNIN